MNVWHLGFLSCVCYAYMVFIKLISILLGCFDGKTFFCNKRVKKVKNQTHLSGLSNCGCNCWLRFNINMGTTLCRTSGHIQTYQTFPKYKSISSSQIHQKTYVWMFVCITSLQSIWVIVYLFVRLSVGLPAYPVSCATHFNWIWLRVSLFMPHIKSAELVPQNQQIRNYGKESHVRMSALAVQSYLSVCLSIQSIWFVSNMCFPVCSTWDRYKILGVYPMRSMGFLRWG